jgi:tryptophan synthase alpha chain
MTTRIETTFNTLREQGKKALIPYVMAGDPNPTVTVSLLHELVDHGADVIEVGLPFSDPMADGETIALAGERAIAAGTSTRQAIDMVREFRKNNQHTPVLVMGYLNPVEIIGYDKFIAMCEDAGIDGVLMVDLPPQEAGSFTQKLANSHMNEIFLLAPTTLPARRDEVLKHGSGFIYYVSVKGVTGSKALDAPDVSQHVQAIKAQTALPVCVGFGIRDGASAKAVGQDADGVIVGSELVKNFANVGNDEQQIAHAKKLILDKMDELRQAIDSL